MTGGVAGRYASALFELAQERNELDEVDQDLGKFQALLDGSDLEEIPAASGFSRLFAHGWLPGVFAEAVFLKAPLRRPTGA